MQINESTREEVDSRHGQKHACGHALHAGRPVLDWKPDGRFEEGVTFDRYGRYSAGSIA
jgi:hypothetical protein